MAKWSYVTLLERVAEELADMSGIDEENIIADPRTSGMSIDAADFVERLKQQIVDQARRDRAGKDK